MNKAEKAELAFLGTFYEMLKLKSPKAKQETIMERFEKAVHPLEQSGHVLVENTQKFISSLNLKQEITAAQLELKAAQKKVDNLLKKKTKQVRTVDPCSPVRPIRSHC